MFALWITLACGQNASGPSASTSGSDEPVTNCVSTALAKKTSDTTFQITCPGLCKGKVDDCKEPKDVTGSASHDDDVTSVLTCACDATLPTGCHMEVHFSASGDEVHCLPADTCTATVDAKTGNVTCG